MSGVESSPSKNWRMRKQRVAFKGFIRDNGNGKEVSFTGISWFPLNGNGHNKEKDPLSQQLIYKAPQPNEINKS